MCVYIYVIVCVCVCVRMPGAGQIVSLPDEVFYAHYGTLRASTHSASHQLAASFQQQQEVQHLQQKAGKTGRLGSAGLEEVWGFPAGQAPDGWNMRVFYMFYM
jgi:hypothetical protein